MITKKSLATTWFVLFAITAICQDYYWVGGSGNWSDFANHWATSSGGSTFHTSAPTGTNDVYFDANSFTTTNQVVTLDDFNADCKSMDWTGALNFPSLDGNGMTLNIYGSLMLSPDMTADIRFLEFESTATGNTIATNGTSPGIDAILRFRGVGGEWTLQDNIDVERIDISAGTFNTGDNTIDAESFFQTSGSDTKTINLGSSQISSERVWIQGTNQTINAGTSKLITSSFYTDTSGDGPFTFYDVEFTNYGVLRHNATFNEVTIPIGLEVELQAGDVFTVNNLVADGTKHVPIIIKSDAAGNEASFSKASGSITVSYVELQDIHAIGGATFTANESSDKGNTTGWTINAPTSLDYYWVGDGGDWSDFANHWATTSGGSTMHTDYPGRHDNVYFDANSFSTTGQEVATDILANFHHMDWTGALNDPKLRATSTFPLNAYGSVTFIQDMSKSISVLKFYGDDPGLTFTALGTGNNGFVSFNGDGTYDLLSDIDATSFYHYSGTVNYNNVTIDCSTHIIGTFPNNATANLGSATIICTNLDVETSPLPTVDKGTSSFQIDGDLDGAGIALYDVTMTGTGQITGSNTFEFLTLEPGSSVSLEGGETQTINQTISLDGTKANPISLNSSVNATQATLSMGSGTLDATYLILQDIAATGGATFNATQTIDNGNNTGWNITGIVGEDYYWVGDGGDWSDFASHWTTSSGGSTFHTTVPGVLDNVIFDANSFSTPSEIVTIDNDQVNFNDLDASAVSQAFTISGSGKEMNVYGSLEIPTLVTTQVSTFNFLTTGSETIGFNNGPGDDYDLNFSSGGTWTLTSDLTAKVLEIQSGTFSTDDHDLNLGTFSLTESSTKIVNLGTSDVHATFITVHFLAENVTINGGSSNLFVSRDLSLEEYQHTISLNNLTFLNTELPHFESKISDDLTLNNFTIGVGKEVRPVGTRSLTVNSFTPVGTEVEPITITATDEVSSLTITQNSGTVNGDYLQLDNITVTGGATFNAFNSVDNGNVVGWIFHRDSQTITFGSLSDKTYGDAPFELAATVSSGLDVTFSIVSGPVTIDGTTLSITGVGTAEIKAEQSGDIDYDPAPSVIRSFEIAKADQVISFDALSTKKYGDDAFDLAATGGDSGEPVTYSSSDETVATIDGRTVTIVGAGATTITASQEGSDLYNAATNVEQLLTVDKADQTISFDLATSYDLDTETDPITLIATASSGLEVEFQMDGPAILEGNVLTPTGIGIVTITASQGGDDNHNQAPDVEMELSVVSSALGLLPEELSISIYPNPAQDFLHIESQENMKIELSIHSVSGKVIHRENIKSKIAKLDLSIIPPGIYMIVLTNDKNIIGTSRLIME